MYTLTIITKNEVSLIPLNPYFESFSINCILIRRNRFNTRLHSVRSTHIYFYRLCKIEMRDQFNTYLAIFHTCRVLSTPFHFSIILFQIHTLIPSQFSFYRFTVTMIHFYLKLINFSMVVESSPVSMRYQHNQIVQFQYKCVWWFTRCSACLYKMMRRRLKLDGKYC